MSNSTSPAVAPAKFFAGLHHSHSSTCWQVRPSNHDWEDLYKDHKWLVLNGTVVTMEVTDDTLPSCPRQVARNFKASFVCASREDDYRVAWAFFAPIQVASAAAELHQGASR